MPSGDQQINVHNHYHFEGPWLGELCQVLTHGFDRLIATLKEGFTTMSEASDALTQAVTLVASKVDTTSTTLQTELGEIAKQLADASDADLRAAATDAVTRLGVVAEGLDVINTTIQGIVP